RPDRVLQDERVIGAFAVTAARGRAARAADATPWREPTVSLVVADELVLGLRGRVKLREELIGAELQRGYRGQGQKPTEIFGITRVLDLNVRGYDTVLNRKEDPLSSLDDGDRRIGWCETAARGGIAKSAHCPKAEHSWKNRKGTFHRKPPCCSGEGFV